GRDHGPCPGDRDEHLERPERDPGAERGSAETAWRLRSASMLDLRFLGHRRSGCRWRTVIAGCDRRLAPMIHSIILSISAMGRDALLGLARLDLAPAKSGGAKMQVRQMTALATVVLVLGGAAHNAQAQKAGNGWAPEGNVEFIVGAGPGGENDRIARAIQHALGKEHLVESMTVLNRPGAAQTIAINYLAGKKGDANAIGLASGSFINAIARNGSSLHKNVAPLMKLFDAYQAYFTRVDSPIKSMVDVRDRLKADPSSVTFAFPVGL